MAAAAAFPKKPAIHRVFELNRTKRRRLAASRDAEEIADGEHLVLARHQFDDVGARVDALEPEATVAIATVRAAARPVSTLRNRIRACG